MWECAAVFNLFAHKEDRETKMSNLHPPVHSRIFTHTHTQKIRQSLVLKQIKFEVCNQPELECFSITSGLKVASPVSPQVFCCLCSYQ